MISCFLERTRRNVKSFDASSVRTTLRALAASCEKRDAYCVVCSA
eukprot:CAMPEP_0185592102 /NCGR_PEP_ID=MMETSP0434-20130131/66834_1 /TAXON_ID=626734 ORGANISM="Favella taraikaensis, Strain Fe Narragansett Bay" /NCGR_SAMPLE_ID=MMETSP0434 /ASSEMBLY_ACC=CAM_ASM_000379 /LENGTH=44 /DNA_ID= /DNA_START= /DNA_END= /DNA_ORIENTATION=